MHSFRINISQKPFSICESAKQVGIDLKNRFTYADAGIVGYTRSAITENADICSIVNINLDNYNCLLYLAPELNKNANALSKYIKLITEKVKNPKGELSAVVAGGRWNVGKQDKNAIMSMDFLNKISKFFDERGIPLSIIFGKHSSSNLDNASVRANEMLLWNKSYQGLNLRENPTKELPS